MALEKKLRGIILLQLFLFVLGALSHAGVLPFSYQHPQAMRAESVIAVILLIGFLTTFMKQPRGRKITLGTQIFGFLGTLVGLTMIVIGIGPRTVFDFFLHAGMICSFLAGFWLQKKWFNA